MVESILTMFHLRRVQFQAFVKEAKGRAASEPINDAIEPNGILSVRERSTMILLDKQTKIGRNPELVDVVLHSVVHSNMISRDHSEIIGETDSKGQFVRYYISDRSLNGTYVNDTRVKESVLLSEGDLIKFGHVNGAAIKPGEHAPQHTAEFIFRFERALPKFTYFGYSQKGVRVHAHQSDHTQQQQQRRAYMQINSDRILPTEVYSLAPTGGGAIASAVGGGNGPTVPRPIPLGCSAAVNNSVATSTATSSSVVASSFPLLHPAASSSSTTTTAATVIPSCPAATSANNGTQTAQLAAAATLSNTATTCNSVSQQQQQRIQSNGGTIDASTSSAASAAASTLNALSQLGLTSATEEQVAAVNAHLRQLMASHDAMSAMERLAAQQQWNNSLLKLSSLQQQNPLVYGHAFPAAAAAAAALFTGCIDLNSAAAAAAGTQNTAAAQYAASLWPSIRALQPSVSQGAEWAQQQKAAAFAQQLQLRLPGLYQQQQQQHAVAACVVQPRGVSVSMPNVAPSLFGTPSAFSLPGTHNQLHNSTNSSASLPSSSAGLLIAAQQQSVPASSSSSSVAYASCTSSASSAVGFPSMRPLGESPVSSLSRGTSSISLPLHHSQGIDQHQQQQNPAAALAARLAAAQQLAKELEEEQQVKSTASGWTMGIPCTSAAGTPVPVTKVSPVVGSSNGSAGEGGGVVGGATTPLQRIPGIASALAAAVVAAQKQQHNVPPWPSETPPNSGSHPSLDTPPIRQPLAQRIFSPAVSNSSSMSLSSGSSKSSSGVSSAPSSGLLQSPGAGGTTTMTGLSNSDAGKEFRDSFSSLLTANSLTTSAFSSPKITNNTMNTLTTAMLATERDKAAKTMERQRTIIAARTSEETKTAEAEEQMKRAEQKDRSTRERTSPHHHYMPADHQHSLNGSSTSISSGLNQLQTDTSSAFLHGDDGHEDSKITDGLAMCEQKREQMECDSSVPSPPPGGKEQTDQLLNMLQNESFGKDNKEQRDKIDLSDETSSPQKRHSSPGSPVSLADESIDAARDNKAERDKSGSTNPRPIKQARKSNEVARLLNDLTAGNCTGDGSGNKNPKNGKNPCDLDALRKSKVLNNGHEEKKGEKEESIVDRKHGQKRHFGRDRTKTEKCLMVDECEKGKSRTMSDGHRRKFLEECGSQKCSWQYMAERSQKLAAQGTKSTVRGDVLDSTTSAKGGRAGLEKMPRQKSSQLTKTERKRPLRLEERTRAEMERKRAHKMMRQISDESSDEEHGGGSIGKRENMTNNSSNVQQRHDDDDRKKNGSPHLSTSDEEGDDNGRKSPAELDSSDSDHHSRKHKHKNNRRRKSSGNEDIKIAENSQTKEMGNGNGTLTRRKLLSSAPGTKKAMALMNNMTTTTANKLVNGGQRNGDGPLKRGPKGRAEDKGKADRSSKKLGAPTAVAASTAFALKKASRKMGNGRGRPAGIGQKDPERLSNSRDPSDDDTSSIDQPIRLADRSREVKQNGGESTTTTIKGTGRKGRYRSRRRDESPQDLAATTVAEDWTGGSGDPELCAHKKCQRPLHMAINWVQCDDCDQWFHATCVFGNNTNPDDDSDFHCGCGAAAKKTAGEPKIANAKSLSAASLLSTA